MIRISTRPFEDVTSFLHTATSSDHLDTMKVVSEIRDRIASEGDDAVLAYNAQFDGVSLDGFEIKVSEDEIRAAYDSVDAEVVASLKRAHSNVLSYHQHQLPKSWRETLDNGVVRGMEYSALESVGLYVPGGRAPYPSTVLMNAVPALLAGVDRVQLITPPLKDGSIAPQILVAADICGVRDIYKVGGAQGVFALAYGTDSVPKVDKIVGPGNRFVTAAKQLVYGVVDIDKPAGPSEVLVYADSVSDAPVVAAELMAQLEHDPDARAFLVTDTSGLAEATQEAIKAQIGDLSRQDVIRQSMEGSCLFVTSSRDESIQFMNKLGSEHLVVLSEDYDEIWPHIRHAGALFLGPYTPVALGDYFAGPNHVLPTESAVRFSSPLSVMDFMKFSSVLYYPKDALSEAQEDMQRLTDLEGFDAHGKSVTIRLG